MSARLAEASSVEVVYGDEQVTLIANGPTPKDCAALSMLSTRCGMFEVATPTFRHGYRRHEATTVLRKRIPRGLKDSGDLVKRIYNGDN